MTVQKQQAELGTGEFVVLMALMISLVALSIDTMLPALPEIGAELGVVEANDNQLVLSVLFLGLAVGQMFYGPLSDSIGRKPAIYAGVGLFIVGCLLSIFATDFNMMLAGRLLQGMGAAGPRIVSMALIRDGYEGRAMARIMSFVMGVFILVPTLAPALGQLVLMVADWRGIFVCFLVLAVISFVWFAVRQPETLPPEKRTRFSVSGLFARIAETCSNRKALGYTIAGGLIFGAFVGYLNSSQQILQQQYGLGTQFALYFAALSLAIGGASFINARLVMRFGMRLLSRWALQASCLISIVFLGMAMATSGHPPLWALMIYFLGVFFCMGLLFGNFNALAMEPMGHIAGVAAAVIGSLTTFISLFMGTVVGRFYDGTVIPLVVGFAVLSVASYVVMHVVERGATD